MAEDVQRLGIGTHAVGQTSGGDSQPHAVLLRCQQRRLCQRSDLLFPVQQRIVDIDRDQFIFHSVPLINGAGEGRVPPDDDRVWAAPVITDYKVP